MQDKEAIKNEFKNLYMGKDGIYMVRLNLAGVIMVTTEEAIVDFPTEYKGVPVSVEVSPMMKTF